MYSFGIVMAEIKVNYNTSQGLVNLIYSLNTGLLFCSGTVAYALADQFGVRAVVMVAGAVTALCNMILAFLPDAVYIAIAYGGVGGKLINDQSSCRLAHRFFSIHPRRCVRLHVFDVFHIAGRVF